MGVTGMAPLPALGGDTAGRKERKRSNEEKKKRRKMGGNEKGVVS